MKDSDAALKKIAKGAGLFFIGLLISKVLAYAYRLIIARISVEQYGMFSIALAIFNVLVIISILGMGDGVIRFVSFYKGKTDQRRIKGVITSALKITLPFSLIWASFLFLGSSWIANTFFHNSNLSILFKIFALGIPLDVLRSIFFSSITAFQKVEYEIYAKSIAENVVKVMLTLIAIYLGFGITGAAIAYIISIFISFILSLYFLEKKVFPIIHTQIASIRSDKELLVYSLPLLFTGFIFLIVQWTDTLMLGSLRTVSEVGIYNVAAPTAALLGLFPSAIRTLFLPVLNEIYAQNKKAAFKSVYQTISKWVVTLNSITFVFLIVFSYQIIRILFGEAYVKDKTMFLGWNIPLSVLALIVLSAGLFFAYLFVSHKDALAVLKRTKLIFLNTLVGAGLNIVLNYFLIPPYGIIGAAIATAFSYFTIATLVGIEAHLITRINPFKLNYIKIIITNLLILSIMILFKFYLISNILYMAIISLIFLIVYLILLLIIKAFDKEDIMIANFVFQKLKINIDLNKKLERFI